MKSWEINPIMDGIMEASLMGHELSIMISNKENFENVIKKKKKKKENFEKRECLCSKKFPGSYPCASTFQLEVLVSAVIITLLCSLWGILFYIYLLFSGEIVYYSKKLHYFCLVKNSSDIPKFKLIL